MNQGRGRAAPGTGRMLGATTRRSGLGAPGALRRCGGTPSPLAQGPTLRGAPRLALYPFSPERDPFPGS
jgi:hypothetical protein